MTQNNINPVNNNAINKDKYTHKLNCHICQKMLVFFHFFKQILHGHMYGQIIGGARPPVALLGGPVPPPGPLGSYSTDHMLEILKHYGLKFYMSKLSVHPVVLMFGTEKMKIKIAKINNLWYCSCTYITILYVYYVYRRSCYLCGSEIYANLLKLPTTKFMREIFMQYWYILIIGGVSHLCAKIYIVF